MKRHEPGVVVEGSGKPSVLVLSLWFPVMLPGTNEIILLRSSRWRGKWNAIKRRCEDRIKGLVPPGTKVEHKRLTVIAHWYEWNTRRDPDNIAGGMKMLNDALQAAGVIPNDGWDEIESITHRFRIAESQEQVGVLLEFWLCEWLRPVVKPAGRKRKINNRLT